MTIININPINDPRYRVFINAHPSATVFHTPEWLRVLHETYGFKPGCTAIENGNSLQGVLPYMVTQSFTGKTRVVSLPFSDFCEPLLSDRASFDAVLGAMVNNHPKASYIDIRGGKDLLGNEITGQTVLTHDIDCTRSEDALFRSLRTSVQRNIRKAEHEKLTCSFATTVDAVKQFYEFNCVTRKEHGLPPQPWKFFENIWKNCIGAGNGFIATVQCNGNAIALALFLVFGKKVYYKYGASVKKYHYCRPNDFIIWKSILHCNNLKYGSLNLGRTEPQHTGLLHFKRGWGGAETLVSYFRYMLNISSYAPIRKTVCNTVYMAIVSRTPVLLLKPIGSFIHQYAG